MWILVATFLSVAYAQQSFEREPEDQSVIKGQTHIFHCSIRNLRGKVQWMKDGFGLGYDRDLPGYGRYSVIGSEVRGEYNLMISNVQLEDDAIYECQVGKTSPEVPGLISRKAKLNVLIPPDVPIVENGPQIVVTHGEPYNLTCLAANSKPAPNITWTTPEVNITGDIYDSIVSHNNKLVDGISVLTITPDKDKDQGRALKCHAMNIALNSPKWTRVYLEVQYPPEVKMTDYPRAAREYGTVSFTCEATGNPSEITWKWFQDGHVIAGETSDKLDLRNIQRDLHTKDIVCEATNAGGSSSRSFTMNIEYGPRFVNPTEHAAADVGGSVSMRCRVDGNPHPAVFWRAKNDPQVLSTLDWYNISAVAGRHFGIYTCTASVAGFSEVSRDVHLMEKRAPKVIAEKEQKARIGETGVLSCLVESVPKPPQIIWQKNGVAVDFKGLERYSVRMEDISDNPAHHKSIIEIISVQDDDFGEYNCSLENGYGFDMMQISFSKQEVWPLPYILTALLVGVLIIIIIAALVFIYHRRKSTAGSVSSSNSSDESLDKKEDPIKPEYKVEYSSSFHSNPIDAWQPDSKYDQSPPAYDGPNHKYAPNDYDFNDGYGNSGYDYARDIYGTFPRNQSRNYNYHNRYPAEDPYGPVYGSDTYGTYRAPVGRSRYAASDYGPSGVMASDYGTLPPPPASDYGIYTDEASFGRIPPPPPSISSRLSTNV